MADIEIKLRSKNIARFLNSEEVKNIVAKESESVAQALSELTGKPTEIRKSQSTEPRARVEVVVRGVTDDDLKRQVFDRALSQGGGQ